MRLDRSRAVFRWPVALLFLLAGAWMALPARAERVEPPLELLYGNGNLLVAGSLVEINPAGRLVFRRREVLSGAPEPPELIDVRVPLSSLSTARIGERYIVGYSPLAPDPRKPTRLVPNPDGATVLTSIGLEPALYRDTPALRTLLKAGRDEHERESERLFDLLLKALTGNDHSLQTLAAGELALEPELGEHLRESGGRARIEGVVRSAKTSPDIRATLLVAAAARPTDFGDWWSSAALGIVTTTPAGGYSTGAGDPTNLVLSALELLDTHAVTVPPDALKRWVWSPQPPLVERASLMLRRQSPALERSAVQQALADPKLPAVTRKFLDDHLRRLDRMDATSKARKDGTA